MTAYTDADVERVAKALCAHEYSDDTRWDKLGETETDAFRMYRENGNEGPLDSREDFRESARAALAAMPDGRDAALEEAANVAARRAVLMGNGLYAVGWNDCAKQIAGEIAGLKSQPASGGWNFDMGAAPRDGTRFLARWKAPGADVEDTIIAYWGDDFLGKEFRGENVRSLDGSWTYAHVRNGFTGECLLTAWRHIPSPPSQGSGE